MNGLINKGVSLALAILKIAEEKALGTRLPIRAGGREIEHG